jgi:histone acetyltransferase (RNA polymerase elongator complex component)
MGAIAARIYPTVVFRDTELAAWMGSGCYTPLSDEEAVRRSKNVYEVFLNAGIPCLRIGLCENENLHSDSSYLAGPNHSAMGEMVMSAVYRDRIVNAIPAEGTENKALIIRCPLGHTSKVLGHRAQTKKELIDRFGFSAVKVKESAELNDYTINLDLI